MRRVGARRLLREPSGPGVAPARLLPIQRREDPVRNEMLKTLKLHVYAGVGAVCEIGRAHV